MTIVAIDWYENMVSDCRTIIEEAKIQTGTKIPPWQYEFSVSNSRSIKSQLLIPAAEGSVLFLWSTAPKLREALGVMEAWKIKI